MNRTGRYILFFPSAIVLFALFAWAVRDLPPFGHYRGPYGELINNTTVFERHITDAVTAVNFDFRCFDTLGEETILFLSVMGAATILRRQRREQEKDSEKNTSDELETRRVPDPSDAVKVNTLGLVGPLVVFGLYIVAHGQLTPGGGFQGGVILATAPLLVYLGGDMETFKRITTHFLVELGEAAGIFSFVSIGLIGVFAGVEFLRNVLPYGQTGSIFSGGTVPLLNLATGIAVAGGFISVMYAFLEQTLEMRMQGGKE
jgi:multicomponent Na+:H+ antiporter subunit B